MGEEEGGRQEAKLRLPGSIVAPLSRAELFQRPRPRIGSPSTPVQAKVGDSLRRTLQRPRSPGGRRLKAGSEANSLREKAIITEGSREGARRQTAIKAEETNNRIQLPTRIPQDMIPTRIPQDMQQTRIPQDKQLKRIPQEIIQTRIPQDMLSTRIPQQKQLILKPQKQNPQSSPLTRLTGSIHLESMMNPDLDENEEESTTSFPINIFDGQYHEVNPGQYNETNPGQYHEENPGQYHETNPGQYEESDEGKYLEINPGQYEAVVEYNAEEETKSYNVHRKTGDYIIGEVGKININNGQTLEGVRYTAVEGMVNQEQIAEILARYFGTGQR